jgi:hypothetical protein
MKDMKTFSLLLFFLSSSAFANEGLPHCKASLHDSVNQTVNSKEWQESLYLGSLGGATHTVLISTSLGHEQIMSLWVREKKEKDQAGMFSFVDLSSGKEQYMRFYMADGYSVSVTCRWAPSASN